MKDIEIITRPYDAKTDNGYIYSTWIKFSWYSADPKSSLSKRHFFQIKAQEIKETIEQGTLKIACLKNEPAVIMGYIAARDGKLKWICVKKDFHGQGIEELLQSSMKGIINEQETDK